MLTSPQPRLTVGLVGIAVLLAAALAGMAGAAAADREAGPAAAGSTAPPVRFGRDIRPILADRCFRCHGPDPKTRAADLRLDLRENAIAKRDRGAAVVPGEPETGELWKRITSDDPNFRMPPPDSNKRPLSTDERELIRRWVAQGAVYEPHWAFVPPRRVAPPEVKNPAWVRNPVDQFVLARLEQDGLAPSPEADRETLLRRLFLDITGLPPAPEELDAFLADARPDAYERWIDKLFTEEPYRTRYAERMTVPWLDAARYADTCGIHMDAGRQMWLWRDWVLNAFKGNMPFDRFVTEQLAGDLLPSATESQKIASGFNRNHVTTDEGGAIAEEYIVEYAVDRASTTGSVLLGLTLGCARCHEHKFDPVSQDEFFRFYAFFNSIEEPGLYSQLPDPNRAFEPFMVVATVEQKQTLAELREKLTRATAELAATSPEEEAQQAAFLAEASKKSELAWPPAKIIAADSTQGATLAIQPDGSVLASGKNPDKDEHVLTLRTEARDLRLLLIEALPDASLFEGRTGRAPNGNAVVTDVEAEAVSIADASQKAPVKFIWAWADLEQANGDFRVVNVLDGRDDRGWALDAHNQKAGRVAVLLADKPFGFEGGTDLRVRLKFNSIYGQHVLGRIRLSVGRLADAGLDLLPPAASGWYRVGPFPVDAKDSPYEKQFGPEEDTALDTSRNFGFGNQFWRYAENLRDDQVNGLGDGRSVVYVGRYLLCPTPRKVEVSLGSDDGFILFLNGKQVARKEVSRGVAPDQDKAVLELAAGRNTIVLKIVNTGGVGGFYYRAAGGPTELTGDLAAALVPESARTPELRNRLTQAWKLTHSPGYRDRRQLVASLEKRIPEIEAQAPRTMIMQELPKPRETFVLTRGQYDKPDKARPVTRGVPAALGKLPDNAPQNRLGLAQWMTAADNPLVARVAVNRLWELAFGNGLVRTSEDFGLQGEWPTHPELLDWLAVEFRESGWNVQHVLKLMLASNTYRQSSRVRPDIRERDPDDRLLAWYPRRRLGAEAIRDQALFVSGLLVEQLGGPSVKPYQPDGLWQEVAMIQSNTRIYQRGEGPDLWRRSLYTYWKRACPPPSLMTFDAPTRESCTIRRPSTNTPLQALVLWNDEQYVEAARSLAQRTLKDAGDDGERLSRMFRRCTGRSPGESEMKRLRETLAAFRDRYRQSPEDAAKLLKVGTSPVPEGLDPPELAAWTMMANALLNLSATVTQS